MNSTPSPTGPILSLLHIRLTAIDVLLLIEPAPGLLVACPVPIFIQICRSTMLRRDFQGADFTSRPHFDHDADPLYCHVFSGRFKTCWEMDTHPQTKSWLGVDYGRPRHGETYWFVRFLNSKLWA